MTAKFQKLSLKQAKAFERHILFLNPTDLRIAELFSSTVPANVVGLDKLYEFGLVEDRLYLRMRPIKVNSKFSKKFVGKRESNNPKKTSSTCRIFNFFQGTWFPEAIQILCDMKRVGKGVVLYEIYEVSLDYYAKNYILLEAREIREVLKFIK